ncbi:MAG TPA: hypothetical protein VGX68_27680 [Thermoanaerobaculia bacterium]|jgi:hypothetical protein|nr:hypothetical protein [Thermoanaerobaculia bacterium]
MPRTPIAETVGDWMGLTGCVTPETVAEIPSIQVIYDKLVASLAEIQELIQQRDFHEARKQELSRRIDVVLPKGRKEASLVRAILKVHYGPDNEKLAAFGIQPFRSKKRRRKDGSPSPETPERDKGK